MKELGQSPYLPEYVVIRGAYGRFDPSGEGPWRSLDIVDGRFEALKPETVAHRLRNQNNVNLYEMRGTKFGKGDQGYHLTYKKQKELAILRDKVRFDRTINP